ncbi:unnamed protein product [Gordionus sp. m RMFG-2023]
MLWFLTFNIIFYPGLYSFISSQPSYSSIERKKNILFVVVDDLGWNDVGWNNPDMPTPTLNLLANNGIILNQSYALPLCTPSRAAFMTGYYPYKLGLQSNVIEPLQPNAISLKRTLLPSRLKRLGYSTYMVGKWHLGYCNKKFVPNSRGFDSFFGYYTGGQDHFRHNANGVLDNGTRFSGYDFHENYKPYREAIGVYSSELYTKKTIEIIENHDSLKPFFLYLAFQNVHCPLQIPGNRIAPSCQHIENKKRRVYCSMLVYVDLSMKEIVKALKRNNLYRDTLIVFTSDNGGQVLQGASNYPLRGNKGTIWEGGIRVAGFIHAKFLKLKEGYVSNKLIHAVDWYPTFVELAGGSRESPHSYWNWGESSKGDGISQWNSIIDKNAPAPRNHFLINLMLQNRYFAGIRYKDFKLLLGNPGDMDGWYDRPNTSNKTRERKNSRNKSGGRIAFFPIKKLKCRYKQGTSKLDKCREEMIRNNTNIWYFNIKKDPYEENNMVKRDEIFFKMLDLLVRYSKSYKRPTHKKKDPKGSPIHFDGFFNFGWCDAF